MSAELKQTTTKGIDSVRCPYCGNPVCGRTYIGNYLKYTVFVAYCWNGDIHKKPTPEHIFKIYVLTDREVWVEDQPTKKNLEEEKNDQ